MNAGRGVARVALVVCVCVCACGQGSSPRPAERASLGGGDVARVGAIGIRGDLVANVARARGLSPAVALDDLVDDALAAQGAVAEGLDRRHDTHWATLSATGRLAVKAIREAAHAAGPPNDAEVRALTAEHWKDYALPEQVEVIHAVVVRPHAAPGKPPDPTTETRGRAVADQIARAVAAAATADDFESAAKLVDSAGFDVRVERLPPFVADGRVSAPGDDTVFDPKFTAAAFALKSPGDTSPVVETPAFGWHVIRLLARLSAKEVPIEERRVAFADETYALRARAEHDRILRERRAHMHIELAPAVDAILAELPRPELAPQ